MAFVNEIPSAEDIEKFDLPYKPDLSDPIELRRDWAVDRERDVYVTGPGGIGKQDRDEPLKRYFVVYLGRSKIRVLLEPQRTTGDYKNSPYHIHWPALHEIWALRPQDSRFVEIYNLARQNPDSPNSYLRNYSLNEFLAIFKEAATVRKEGFHNRFILTPVAVAVTFGF